MVKSAIKDILDQKQTESEYSSISSSSQPDLLESNVEEPSMTPIPWRPFVKKSGVGQTPGEIGWYVGVISASFALSQATTAMFWGVLSDRVGRKPVLAYGMVGSGIAVLLFGFTNDYYLALAIRIFDGMVNGNVSVLKSVMGEISDPTNRPQVFAFLPLCWNGGVIIGPLIGGFLYDPVHKFPSVFKGIEIFEKFPHLLPCLVSFIFYVIGTAIVFFTFQETLILKKKNSSLDQTNELNPSLSPSPNPIPGSFQSPTPSSNCYSSSAPRGLFKSSSDETLNNHLLNFDSYVKNHHSSGPKLQDSRENLDERSSLLSSINFPNSHSAEEHRSFRSKFTPTMVTVFVTNSTMTLANSMFESFFSVWVAADLATGGLEFSTENISLVLGLSGLAIFYLQLVIYPKYNKKHGTLNSYTRGLKMSTPTSLLLPLITNSTLSAADLGLMNGIQHFLSSTTRFIGPMFAGFIWKYTHNSSWSYPFDSFLTWNVIGLIFFYTYLYSKNIPKSVDKSYID
ncbi:Protein ZINC INDUCED FACILITATOR 1 [Smittium mucronatum]|uniref:Protein ZINC INDUCED FACILITATOR 1 n=1 Tax=Smittium mucronatum TaxID=133383 RepID=A0A1R0GMM0_9FUNG|nr:Protein ZINC INDUCED FACILITATOR 1 [Smittium mucronatum]